MGIRLNNNANNNNINNININNINQNNLNNININNTGVKIEKKKIKTNEEILEGIDLTQDFSKDLSGYKKYNFEDSLDDNPVLKKFLSLKKIQAKINILKEKLGDSDIKEVKNAEPGAISYGLPVEAIYDRKIENEVKRLEIELINQKLLKIYESPKDSLINFSEQKIK